MSRFLALHVFEHAGRAGIVLAQAVREVGIDTAILFFERDRKRKDLAFRQIFEALRHGLYFSPASGSSQTEDQVPLLTTVRRDDQKVAGQARIGSRPPSTQESHRSFRLGERLTPALELVDGTRPVVLEQP